MVPVIFVLLYDVVAHTFDASDLEEEIIWLVGNVGIVYRIRIRSW
jgi:hypothetical protein